MVLLSGDLFDGAFTQESLQSLTRCFTKMAVPIFITPGNHDFAGSDSPWLTNTWPENVHIFTRQSMKSVALPDLDCRVYGGGFTSMDCPGLLEGFAARQTEHYAIGILHGDPTQIHSPYCPITTTQVAESNLDYLALGHIHKGGSFRSGKTLCAWPGCPMGRGYDEGGEKGVLIVTMDTQVSTQFVGLGMPQFFDLEAADPQCLATLLPPVGNDNFYRVTLTGVCETPNLEAILREYERFPNLVLRDKTIPPLDVWASVTDDTFEGIYFRKLQDALEHASNQDRDTILLAAKLSRSLLDGQEVVLP